MKDMLAPLSPMRAMNQRDEKLLGLLLTQSERTSCGCCLRTEDVQHGRSPGNARQVSLLSPGCGKRSL